MALNAYPIIFIPGIMGTTLSDHYPIDHTVVYSAVFDKLMTNFDPIMLDDLGQYDKALDRLIRENEVLSLVYGEIVAELRENLPLDEKGSENAKAYVFPYDWRYSINDNALKLSGFVDLIIRKSDAHRIYRERKITVDKVNLVGHSMGGCLAKHYATVLGGEKKINKLVMLAAPLRGSLDALKHMVMGETWFFDWFTRKGKRKAVRTFPGVYDLLPFDGYSPASKKTKWPEAAVSEDGKPLDIFNVGNWQQNVIEQLGREVLKGHVDRAFSFFEGAADFSDGFRENVVSVYGTGEKTMRHITASIAPEGIEYDFPKDGDCPKAGDGTVPAISAYAEGVRQIGITKKQAGDWELDLGKLAGFHASFCAYDIVQDIVISFLRGEVIRTITKEKTLGFKAVGEFPKFTEDMMASLDEGPKD